MKLKFTLFITILFLSAIVANAQNPLLGKWKLVSISDNMIAHPNLEGKEVFINFEAKRFNAQVCNQINGNYSIVKNKLKIVNGVSTLMACENMDIEALVNQVLDKTAYFSVRKDLLTLTNKTKKISLNFKKVKPATTASLFGKWRLASMSTDGVTTSTVEKPATLNIEKGKIGGNSGCNTYGGSLSVKGSTLKISEIFSTKMFCEGVPENQYFQALASVKTFEIKNNRLILTDAKKQIELVFEKVEK